VRQPSTPTRVTTRDLLRVGVICFGVSLLTLASSASAAFPGRNGRIVFHARYESSNNPCPQQPESHPGEEGIFTMNPGGGDATQLTDRTISPNCSGFGGDGISDGQPTFSPNGQRIAFTTFYSGLHTFASSIYLMRADGTTRHALTPQQGIEVDPAFSPNGKRIVFSDSYSVYTIRTDGSHKRRIVGPMGNPTFFQEDPTFFPGGKKIAFTGGNNVLTIRLDGTRRRRLTHNQNARSFDPDVSPDGRKIVFTHSLPEPPGYEIRVMRADGTHDHHLADGSGAVFSPNGEKIAFTSLPPQTSAFPAQISVMHASGSDQRVITANPLPFDYPDAASHFFTQPDWGPKP